jgi:polysaccharide pyruvyl transferase WcaK-like protein
MVKLTIIGWYGTETIGDRAILAGLLSLFTEVWGNYEIKLGAIYPFFTEKTICEDYNFYCQCTKKPVLNISIFDSRNKKELDNAIRTSDILIMGGGPLMDMACMFMIEYAFKKAKKLKKKTMILGCGVGPIHKKLYEKTLLHIVRNSDITVFRDETSLNEYNRLLGKNSNAQAAIDPAVFAAFIFKNEYKISAESKENVIVASIREFDKTYKINNTIDIDDINKMVVDFIGRLSELEKPIHLVPMSYFGLAYDDRKFMNIIKWQLEKDCISVQNKPLSLYETMKVFSEADSCIGMRFHSVVLQTVLNGNNIILDYTDPATGKIGNFIRQINTEEHYKDSYIALQKGFSSLPVLNTNKFTPDFAQIDNYKNVYINEMLRGNQ